LLKCSRRIFFACLGVQTTLWSSDFTQIHCINNNMTTKNTLCSSDTCQIIHLIFCVSQNNSHLSCARSRAEMINPKIYFDTGFSDTTQATLWSSDFTQIHCINNNVTQHKLHCNLVILHKYIVSQQYDTTETTLWSSDFTQIHCINNNVTQQCGNPGTPLSVSKKNM